MRRSDRHDVLPSAPLIAWLDQWDADHPDEPVARIAERAGYSERSLRRIRNHEGGQRNVSAQFVDALLVAAGCPELLHALYPDPDGPTIPLPAPIIRRIRERHHECGFAGCVETDGHGAFGRFCPGHGELLETLREQFEEEDRHGFMGKLAEARERRWTIDESELLPEEVAA